MGTLGNFCAYKGEKSTPTKVEGVKKKRSAFSFLNNRPDSTVKEKSHQ